MGTPTATKTPRGTAAARGKAAAGKHDARAPTAHDVSRAREPAAKAAKMVVNELSRVLELPGIEPGRAWDRLDDKQRARLVRKAEQAFGAKA